MKPEEQYIDAGFVNGKTIINSAENGIKLKCPSSGYSQSTEGFQEENRPLDVADFNVTINDSLQDEIKKLVVDKCSQGHTPIE